MKLIYGQNHILVPWICAQLDIHHPGLCQAIGVEKDGQIIAGCLYNNYRIDNWGKSLSIEISLATIDKRWATRGNIVAMLAYPFHDLRVKRVQLTIAKRNKSVRRFVERLGFTLEGVARKAHEDGTDAAIYSLLWYENKWKLKERPDNRKISTFGPLGPGSGSDHNRSDSLQQGNRSLQLGAEQSPNVFATR